MINKIDLTKKENRILSKILGKQASINPKTTFLIFDDKEISFATAYLLVRRYANGLAKVGVRSKHRICLYMNACPEFIYLSFAINKIGAHWIPVNTDYKAEWLRNTLSNSDPEIIITDKYNFQAIASIENFRPKALYVLAEKKWFEDNYSKVKESLSLDNLLGDDSELEAPNQHYGDTTSILWTSGTTDAPKGVMQSNNTWIRSAQSSIELGQINDGDVAFNCMPLYNSAAWVTSIYPALLTGTTCAIDPTFSASQFWDRTRHYGATHIFTLGAMHMFLWNLPHRENDGENPVRSAQMIPMPDEIIPLFKKRFNINALHQGFGQSEIMYLMRRQDNDKNKYPKNCLGDVAPDIEVALLSENKIPVKTGEPGELCVKERENHVLFNGYFNNPKSTHDSLKKNWYHTGDLLKQNESGDYFFVDRKHDLIRYKGRSVSSLAIESVAKSHPEVESSAAYGIESKDLSSEHEIMLAIVLKGKGSIKESELANFISENAPHFFVPRYIEFLDILPMTPTNKVQKNKLRLRGVTKKTWDSLHKN